MDSVMSHQNVPGKLKTLTDMYLKGMKNKVMWGGYADEQTRSQKKLQGK